jgi:uncharacterized protein (DUF433 family)
MEASQKLLLERITIKSGSLNGNTTIRDLRFPVRDVLELLSSGLTEAEILQEYPILEEDDIRASLLYASSVFQIPAHMQIGIKQGIYDIQNGDIFTMNDFEKKYKELLT